MSGAAPTRRRNLLTLVRIAATALSDEELAALDNRAEPAAGRVLDEGTRILSQLRAPIGAGGFPTAWQARDRSLDEIVAVKILHGQLSRDRTRRQRMFAGARQMARLQREVGDGVVRVIQPEGQHGRYHCFVMEYAAGGDLDTAQLVPQHLPTRASLGDDPFPELLSR